MIAPGAAVRVRDAWPERAGPCHIRTPHYLRGRTGRVVRALGRFENPEDLAFGRPAERLALYHVAFAQAPIWGEGEARDELLVELFETWLEPASWPRPHRLRVPRCSPASRPHSPSRA